MAENLQPTQERKLARKLWLRIVAAMLAVIMLLSVFALDAVRIKLGHDAKTEAEKTGAAALAENSEYLDASTPERLEQWLTSVLRSPETFEDYYQIATVLIAQGEYARALSNIDASIRLYSGGEQPVLDELYMKQGSLHAMLGEYEEMENSFSHVSDESAYRPQKLLLIGQAAIERNDTEKAVSYLAQYLALQPDDRDMRLILGQLYITAGDYANAADTYSYLIKADGDEGGALHFLRGSCHMEAQAYALALEDFIEAKALGYSDAPLCDAQTALCSFLVGAYADCLTYGDLAVKAPSSMVSLPDLHYYMGLAALTLGDYETAYSHFNESRTLDGTRQDSHYYAAVCLMAMGRNDEAIEGYSACIEAGYSMTLSYYNRAACYIAKRQYELAKADLQKVVEQNDDAELVAAAEALLKQL